MRAGYCRVDLRLDQNGGTAAAHCPNAKIGTKKGVPYCLAAQEDGLSGYTCIEHAVHAFISSQAREKSGTSS